MSALPQLNKFLSVIQSNGFALCPFLRRTREFSTGYDDAFIGLFVQNYAVKLTYNRLSHIAFPTLALHDAFFTVLSLNYYIYAVVAYYSGSLGFVSIRYEQLNCHIFKFSR